MNEQPQQPQTEPQAQSPAQPQAQSQAQPQAQPQAAHAAPGPSSAQLAELEQLIAELKERVGALRSGELDAAELEQRLRELNELAVKASGAVDAAAR